MQRMMNEVRAYRVYDKKSSLCKNWLVTGHVMKKVFYEYKVY